ncbi:PREDICTED: ankyrin repeat domain-containing protein 13B [Tarenaya hassleriana]|uniref:ankyrin repeat domain-containing protein 13B n=1 Tax=Tarenaya hassleriana TaxID=28532 RepID=UPI00053C5AF7|nr:PREDICTED: ankyrin repeat domain-containing protein 13B [Tarenaya hassleriana]XP_010524953.1 PREDICTED: ankyrin repeat domain-containing protein 13B [Tarenaya hassleriana]XP_010524954.1 PREDICTED: ankyrin repeat domain-containing protein 13B [Tarenaya hassleriana]
MEDYSKYTHSPAHLAVALRDHAALRRIVTGLPRVSMAGEVTTEAESLEAELRADAISAVIDRRDVPGRETPLHLAVRLRDPISAEILMSSGADWSLQNENGWSALQEAVCTREEAIAMIIARHYQPLAWAKWCRRLPRIVASASRIRDFYMEITFHFESSVIPFISRIAPSDTYRIWKRGSNLRADMTLAGFDGFRIQRSDQTFLFLGEGYSSDNGKMSLPPGSLIVLAHKEKEVTNALEGAGTQPTEAEVAREVALMSQTNMYRPGIDVTQAELVPHLNWRRQERTEMVGNWKAKVYDMLHVMVSVKSRRVPGAMTDEELFAVDEERTATNGAENGDLEDVLTAEERMQLDSALRMGSSDAIDDEENEVVDYHENGSGEANNGSVKEKKSWFSWSKKNAKTGQDESEDPKLKKGSKLVPEDSNPKGKSLKSEEEVGGEAKKAKDNKGVAKKKKKKGGTDEGAKHESEYKKGLRPVLWLTPDFPLKTEELLPLLDILANKVKAVRRLRELLTTKLPPGMFPIKLAIPIVPTIRVLVTFTKFEELQPAEEFSTPPSSPVFHDAKSESSTSWISWMRGNRGGQSSDSDSNRYKDDVVDPFLIPQDYTWVDAAEKKRRLKAKKAKTKKNKKQSSASAAEASDQAAARSGQARDE